MADEMKIGDKFSRLTVKECLGRKILVECECGTEKLVERRFLRGGRTRSCGCLRSETSRTVGLGNLRHGHKTRKNRSRSYKSWEAMKERCANETHRSYKDYGARGVTVCERWLDSFQNFLADMGERPEGTTLDRRDNSKGYYKENCRWATKSQQQRNKRCHQAIRHNVAQPGLKTEGDKILTS
jgi:hypothetical protein